MGKRFFDIFCSFVLLILFSPLFAIIACLVGFTSEEPVIFKQRRVGKNEMSFTIFKFRTMADKSGSGELSDLVTKADDPRVTKIGRFLRATHLDELPQFVNVLRGEMSLVGPRPVSVEIAAIHRKEIFGYDKRFQVPPGMTGLVQTRKRHRKVKTNLRKYLALELFYIERRCFLLDLKILARTVRAVFKMQGI